MGLNMNSRQMLLVGASAGIAAVLLVAALFTGVIDTNDDKLGVVASFYPLAYMAEEIGGERASVRSLIPHNTEVHAWSPAPTDIVAADNADVLLYNGAGLDHWFEDDVLPALGDKVRIVVETTEGLELIPGGEHGDEPEGDDHGDYDPHTWLSPYMARLQAEKIYDAFVEADPDGEEYYSQRWTALSGRLPSSSMISSSGRPSTPPVALISAQAILAALRMNSLSTLPSRRTISQSVSLTLATGA